eukprot:gene2384-2136_t
MRLACLAAALACPGSAAGTPALPPSSTVPPPPPLPAAAAAAAAGSNRPLPPSIAITFGPMPFTKPGETIRSDFFHQLTRNESLTWPTLFSRTGTFKMFLGMLYVAGSPGVPHGYGSTDAELKALIALLKKGGIKTGIEVGGARWGAGSMCDLQGVLAYAQVEQKQVQRWIDLGGEVDNLSTDHAIVWNVRGIDNNPNPKKANLPCSPRVPIRTRIDIVAQMFASWRTFFGPNRTTTTSLGFIESLGYWEIESPDGRTNFTNTDPAHLDKIPGWIPKLDDVTALLLAAAEKHNPTPSTRLITHYQIDFGMEGVEGDTRDYGEAAPVGVNYGRVLGKRPGWSAAQRTLNYTTGYTQLPNRLSQHAVLEQWQPYPNKTGPAFVVDTGMWVATHASTILVD